jgi:hypothetical protein
MKGHKRIYCRKPAQYSGNHRGSHHSGNQQSGRLNNGNNYGGQRFHEIARTEINPNQNGRIKKEVLSVQKRPQVKEGLEIHIHLLPRLEIVKRI